MKHPEPSLHSPESIPYCQICQKSRKTWAELKIHYKKQHNLAKIFTCKEKACDCVFVSEWRLFSHQQLSHGYLKCTICSQLFSHTLQLKSHMEQHFPTIFTSSKRARSVTIDDLQSVTEVYLRKMRRALDKGAFADQTGLFRALQKCTSLPACQSSDLQIDMDLLTFIIHASEVAEKKDRPAVGEIERNPAGNPPQSPDIDSLPPESFLETYTEKGTTASATRKQARQKKGGRIGTGEREGWGGGGGGGGRREGEMKQKEKFSAVIRNTEPFRERCDDALRSQGTPERHMAKSHAESIEATGSDAACPYTGCSECFSDQTSLLVHMRAVHTG